MPSIVQINVSVNAAPAPNTLQKTGALISQGATNLAAGTYSLLTQVSDLTPLLVSPQSNNSMSWITGTVTVNTNTNILGRSIGDTFITTVAGVSSTGPGSYNGTFLATVQSNTSFSYSLASDPGSETVPGTYTPGNQGELQAMVGTFFDQGFSQSVYVLELGPNDSSSGPSALSTWITNNPGFFYAYLVPREWDIQAGLLTLIANSESLTAKTYFFVTTTTVNYPTYTSAMKSALLLIESPNIPITEFSLAAAFQKAISYSPSSTNRMTPLSFSFLYGVTPYPTVGNSALLTNLKNANINYVGTGAEGGVSTSVLFWGRTADGNDYTYWYSVDWIQLNADLAIANAVINGSNNPLSPLYYNQQGINVLQDTVVQTVQSAITFGLANGVVARAALDGPIFTQALDSGLYPDSCVVNAVPFQTYTTENPSDYAIGRYAGLSVVYIPQRGFQQIVFNIFVTNLLTE